MSGQPGRATRIIGFGFREIRTLIKNAGKQRTSRVLLVVLGFLMLAVLSFVIGIIWGIWDTGHGGDLQDYLVPFFLAIFLLVMAIFAPFMPIWPVNVPDGEVWAIMDGGGHFEKLVKPGMYVIRPVQTFKKCAGKGLIAIKFSLRQVVTRDHFPYNVTVNVSAFIDPMRADDGKKPMLVSMTPDMVGSSLAEDITHIIKQEMSVIGRRELDPPALLNTIGAAIQHAVAIRAGMGVALIDINPIKISLEPLREVMASRSELMIEEAKAEARLKHMTELLKLSGAERISIGDLGRLHFILTPQNMHLKLQNNQDLFPAHPLEQRSLPPPREPPLQMPKIGLPPPDMPPAPSGAASDIPPPPKDGSYTNVPVDTYQSEFVMTPTPNKPPPPEPPMDLPEGIPPRPTPVYEQPPAPPPEKDASEVIETVQDKDGTYIPDIHTIPRDPILRRKSRPSTSRDDAKRKD